MPLAPAYTKRGNLIPNVLPPAYGDYAGSGLGPAYGIAPSLDLDFTVPGVGLDGLITFTRASAATYFDSTGTLQTAASGVARANRYQDHNPSTLAPLGFLIEEQRTNSIRNNTMVGASAPSTLPTNWQSFNSGGMTGVSWDVVGTGTESGIDYIDVRVNGTPSDTALTCLFMEQNSVVAALTGQAWTVAQYLRIVAGSTANTGQWVCDLQEYTSGGAFIRHSEANISTPTTAALNTQRTISTITLSGGGTTAFIWPQPLRINVTSVQAVDFTIRIGLPQLEQGAFDTSVIKTTTAAATRLADSAVISGANFASFWNASEGTIVSSASAPQVYPSSLNCIYEAGDGTYNERILGFFLDLATDKVRFDVTDGGAGQAQIAAGDFSPNTQMVMAAAYKAADFAASLDGAAAVTDSSGTLPTVNRLTLGTQAAGGGTLNGHLQSLSYYAARLSDTSLQSLTA